MYLLAADTVTDLFGVSSIAASVVVSDVILNNVTSFDHALSLRLKFPLFPVYAALPMSKLSTVHPFNQDKISGFGRVEKTMHGSSPRIRSDWMSQYRCRSY
jgi:hypothetical protein